MASAIKRAANLSQSDGEFCREISRITGLIVDRFDQDVSTRSNDFIECAFRQEKIIKNWLLGINRIFSYQFLLVAAQMHIPIDKDGLLTLKVDFERLNKKH